jgi:hypothetical protein
MNGVVTIRFMPTKLAVISMLAIAGWRTIITSDQGPQIRNADRLCVIATTTDVPKTYNINDIDNSI